MGMGRFANGAIIRLESVATGRALRIMEDGSVNGNGGNGKKAQFHVIRQGKDVLLRNVQNPNYYLRITENGELCGRGQGGRFCNLRKKKQADSTFTFESVNHPSWHVGILNNGQPKPANNTAEGTNARFRVQRLF
eukprot:TRINITY_DN403_c0_g2_i2.p1 TRINITY_DN403_c0_g2~~TRINITY_DN403_c0_g2_i2.p1  ORF type:complete len:135 (+),score=64.22 TRINITY_DN403_c0_g2_i2:84-488(+)